MAGGNSKETALADCGDLRGCDWEEVEAKGAGETRVGRDAGASGTADVRAGAAGVGVREIVAHIA